MLLPLILPENFYDRIHEILETFPFFNVKRAASFFRHDRYLREGFPGCLSFDCKRAAVRNSILAVFQPGDFLFPKLSCSFFSALLLFIPTFTPATEAFLSPISTIT